MSIIKEDLFQKRITGKKIHQQNMADEGVDERSLIIEKLGKSFVEEGAEEEEEEL